MLPRVSVIIPTYNAKSTIARALESALAQTHPAYEIICVDDCSTDSTREMLAGFASRHAQIRVVHAERNRGPGHARNLGFAAAKGDWIAILDADDAWRPERLEAMVEAGERQGADVVLDNLIFHDAAAGVDVRLAVPEQERDEWLQPERFWRSQAIGRFPLSMLKLVVKAAFLEAHPVKYIDDMRFAEDTIFFGELFGVQARILLLADAHYIYSTPTGLVSKAANSASHTRSDFTNLALEMARLVERYPNLPDDVKALMHRCRKQLALEGRADSARRQRAAGNHLGFWGRVLQPDLAAYMVWRRFRYWSARRREVTLQKLARV